MSKPNQVLTAELNCHPSIELEQNKNSLAYIASDFISELNLGKLELLATDFERNDIGAVRSSRGFSKVVSLTNNSRMVFRQYRHGGLFRNVARGWFLKTGSKHTELRPCQELAALIGLYEQGLSVPKPICLLVSFSPTLPFLYRAFIGTLEVVGAQNLLELCYRHKLEAEELVRLGFEVGEQAAKIVKQGVWHRDLHLGNVLLDPDGRVFVIDFDKAVLDICPKRAEIVAEKISQRWARSLEKHGLSDLAADSFNRGLLEELGR